MIPTVQREIKDDWCFIESLARWDDEFWEWVSRGCQLKENLISATSNSGDIWKWKWIIIWAMCHDAANFAFSVYEEVATASVINEASNAHERSGPGEPLDRGNFRVWWHSQRQWGRIHSSTCLWERERLFLGTDKQTLHLCCSQFVFCLSHTLELFLLDQC